MLLSAQSLTLERKTQLAALREEVQCAGHVRDETAGLVQTALVMLQSGSPRALSSPASTSSFASLSPPSPLSPSSTPSSASSGSQSQSPFPLLSLTLLAGMELDLELEQDATPAVTPTVSSPSVLDASIPSSLAISDTSILSLLTTSEQSTVPSLAISDPSVPSTHGFALAPHSIVPHTPLSRIPSEALIMPPPSARRRSSVLETLPLLEGSEHSRRGSKFSSQDHAHRQTRGVAGEESVAADTVRAAFYPRDSPQSSSNPNAPMPSSQDQTCTVSDGDVSGAAAPLCLHLCSEAHQSDTVLKGTAEEEGLRMTERPHLGEEMVLKGEEKEEDEEGDDGCASEEGDLFEGDQGYGLTYVIGQNSG